MPVLPFIKSAVYPTAHVTGLSRALALRYRGRGIIFALHSVVEDGTAHPDETLRCPVGTLEWLLRRLRRQGVDFVSLDEAIRRLRTRYCRPFAAFTFDDGFADNLTLALPLMAKFDAPLTLYVCTGMITREIDAWWFGLVALIRERQRLELPGLGVFPCSHPVSKARTYAAIERAIHANFDLLPALKQAITAGNIDIRAEVDREALTEQQLRTLARHPLVTIGAHTMTHCNLAQAPAAIVYAEMADNRTFLETLTGTAVAHMAYPFGHSRACGDREAAIARRLGFRTAVTTRPGMVFPAHSDHLHALPRTMVYWHETVSSLRCKLDGFNRAINSRLGDPVARM